MLYSLLPSVVHYSSKEYPQFNESWYWDGQVLVFKNGAVHNVKIAKNFDILEFKIKPSQDTVVTISDNSQVWDKTIFVD
ncbi:hypothetical protein D3C71_1304270 [compost metagenome]